MSDNKKKVLVVDDNDTIRELLGTLLPALGFTTYTAYDGEQGMEKIRQLKPDLICLDVDMPKKTGVQVLNEMHRDPALSDIPVVMITAQKFDAGFPAFMNEHPNVRGFLGKPFTAEELSNLVLKAMTVQVSGKPEGPRFQTVLVAEDDSAFLEQVKRAATENTQVSTAQNGAQTMDHLRKSLPELVVMDALMPNYTGIEILRAMRQDAVRCRIPVILLTDFQMKPEDAAIFKAEFPNLRRVIEKPVAAESLWALIESLPKS